jgi:DNA (cytosine-5)-methyltransferase 1
MILPYDLVAGPWYWLGSSAMAFPDTIGVREKCKVVGNAVPPPVFRAVVSAIPDIW